ncbi:GHKL domain-containing protein [Sedimentibacter acidaminivorans]|nr:GHKL domain-containing protein [Sedimentibacter acidaminivorans]
MLTSVFYSQIFCKAKNNKLHIEITNSFEGTVMLVDKIPISILENHGYGTKSIAAIAEKYSGVYSFTAENRIFRTRIIL